MAETTVHLEQVALSQLERWPRNPKTHDVARVRESIAHFGFVAPLVVDENTGRLVAGHGRLEALLSLKETGAEPPPRITTIDDEWLVPVMRGVSFDSEREAEAYLLADNRLSEVGAWDDQQLLGILQQMEEVGDLAITGFDSDSLEDLAAKLETVPVTDPEEFHTGNVETPRDRQWANEQIEGRAMKEVVMLLPADEHETFLQRVRDLGQHYGTSGVTATVQATIAERHAQLGG